MTDFQETELEGFDEKRTIHIKVPKWAFVTGILLVIFLISALIIPSFIDQDKYKTLIVQKVEESTGYTVSWAGKVGISMLPSPHVSINEVTVAAGKQKILSIKQAEVSVEILPLLQKRVQISNVKLVEPDINLVVDASGRQTWMTQKLNADKEKATKDPNAESDEVFSRSEKQTVLFDSIHIEDGHIIYNDLKKKTKQEIYKFNTDFSLKDLVGPFNIKADFVYNGNEIALHGSADKLIEGKPSDVDFDIGLPKLDVKGVYTGEITAGKILSLKGHLKLEAADLGKTISAFSKSDIKLPEGLNGAFDYGSEIAYDGNNASMKGVTLAVGDVSYQGFVKIEALKKPAPKLTIDITPTSKKKNNSNALIKVLSDLSAKGAGTFINNVVTIDQGTIGFEGQTINLSGSYAIPQNDTVRPRLNAKIKANKIDIDDLQQISSTTTDSAAQQAVNEKANEDHKSGVAGINLPFDGNISGDIGSLNYGGKNYKDVKFDLASNGNSLAINNLSLKTVSDTSVSGKGTIAELNKLSGMDLNADIRTSDVEGLAKAYNVDLKLQQTLGAAAVKGNFKGSLDNLSFDATVDALKFAVTGVGTVKSVTNNPEIQTLNIHVKHPSLQTAVRNFSPGFNAPGSFNGPMDVAATVTLNQKKYEIANIQGSLGTTTVAGKISSDMSGAKPFVNGDLNFGAMVFDTAVPKSGSTKAPAKPDPKAAPVTTETRWSREAIDTTWMDKFNADISIKAASITQDLLKLNNATLAFKLNDRSLTINNLSADGLGGKIMMSGNISSSDAKSPLSLSWSAKATDIDAKQMLSALQNKETDTLSGTIKTFNLDVASSGISPSALVYALSGKGSTNGNNIVVKGVDAAKLADAAKGSYKPLERAGSLLNSFKDGQTAFSDFNADFTIANGVVNFTQIKFDGNQATLTSTGNVNLPLWTVDLKNNMTVKNSEVPPFDFTIQGPLDNPAQAGGSVIEKFLRDKAQAKIEKLITDKLGDKLGLPKATTTEAKPADSTTTVPVEKTKEEKKREQIEQGVKALQGLLGQ